MTDIKATVTRRGLGAMALAGGALLALPVMAQGWPSQPVTLVVPYGPGASNDTFTRALAEILSKKFDQPFVVENRTGAGGYTGAMSVANAEPDGYTFLEIPNGIVSYKPVMKVEDDPLELLQPVTLIATSPMAMVVNSGLGVTTVAEFIEYAKAHPDDTFYGFTGTGTTQHVHARLFINSTGLTTMKGVNYKSSADAQTDLVAGRLQVMFTTVASTLGQIEAGQLNLLAYADSNFPPSAPDAPTMAEAGVDGVEDAQVFWAVFAPKDVPAEIIETLSAALQEAIAEPSFVELTSRTGATATGGGPGRLQEVVDAEKKLLSDFIAGGGLE